MKNWEFKKGKYKISFLKDKSELEEIQQLRYKVYREEFNTDFFDIAGTDADKYDHTYSHLIVRKTDTNEMVGTYRVGFIDEDSYFGKHYEVGEDVKKIFPEAVEVGRLAIDPKHRNGIVMFMLFKGVGYFIESNNKRYFIGAGSIPIPEGQTYEEFVKISDEVVEKINETSDKRLSEEQMEIIPSIMRTYIKMGTKILKYPHHDPEFNCIDYPVFMDLSTMGSKYTNLFIKQ